MQDEAAELFALAGDIVLVGILAALGMLAARNVRGAFIAGIVWYGIDTLLLVLTLLISLTWIPVTVHLVGMVLLVRGFLARNRLVAAHRPARTGL